MKPEAAVGLLLVEKKVKLMLLVSSLGQDKVRVEVVEPIRGAGSVLMLRWNIYLLT